MQRTSSSKLAKQATLVLLLSGAAGSVFPSASGCKKKEEARTDCNIQELFRQSCDGSVCHGGDAPRANLDLVSEGLDTRLFHVQGTEDCDERKLVFPGRPEDSLLYIKVAESDPFCGARMPVGAALGREEIACIYDYIEEAGTDTDVDVCETCGRILCVDFARDPLHCGGCDQPCAQGQVCGDGVCRNPCAVEETLCGSSCVDISSSEQHCGQCDHRCGPGSSCEQGVCACDLGSDGAGGAGGASGGGVADVPSFQADILPIFENSCSGAACHTGADREAPLGLDPDSAYANLVGVTAQECGAQSYVVPGSPDQSYIVEKLMGGSLCAGERMPVGDEPLAPAGVRTFVNWICADAPDN